MESRSVRPRYFEAMSEKNVEVVRRAYQSLTETGDVPPELFLPDVTIDGSGAAPDINSEDTLRSYVETFDGFRVELDELIHADDSCVVTMVRDGGRIKGTDAEISNRYFHVVRFREHRIASWAAYTDRKQALEAAGLSP